MKGGLQQIAKSWPGRIANHSMELLLQELSRNRNQVAHVRWQALEARFLFIACFFWGALTEVEWHYANSHAMHAPPIDINQNSQCPLGQHSALWRAPCTLESPKKPGKHIYIYIYTYR